jgi:ABC-2 type transport system ATP-binding protein
MNKIDDSVYKSNVEFYVDLLDMKEFFHRPIRLLSLGQKMRANIAISLLHNPDVLYLDEPTIGLDVVAKSKIRTFIKEINKERNLTVMLTTHDMRDIEQICDRIIMIDQGKKLYDGTLTDFINEYSFGEVIEVEFADAEVNFENPHVKLLQDEGVKKSYIFKKDAISNVEVIEAVLKSGKVKDLKLQEPDIEEIVKEYYLRR